jgi:P-type Cu+ transporter
MRAKDPVCGHDVESTNDALSVEFHGKTYYFCCSECESEFRRDPDRYAAKAA